jgi:hypothetical protein
MPIGPKERFKNEVSVTLLVMNFWIGGSELVVLWVCPTFCCTLFIRFEVLLLRLSVFFSSCRDSYNSIAYR